MPYTSRRHLVAAIRSLARRKPLRGGALTALLAMLCTAAATAQPAATPPPPPLITPEDLVHLVAVYDPQISPDGRRVAFVASDSLDPTLTQIWIVDADGGSAPRPFTAGGRSASDPRWSPDGRKMIFLSSRSDTAGKQIQLIEADGGESRPLTAEARGVISMKWAPNGREIAYITPMTPASNGDPIDASQPRGSARLRILDLASQETRTVSPDSARVWDCSWSPDSKRLVVLFTRPGTFGEWRRGMLALVRADGSRWTRVPGRVDPTHPAAFSPDGKSLAWYGLPAANYSYPILHVARSDGTQLRRLTPADLPETDEGLLWAPGAHLIVNAFVGVRCIMTRVDPATGARTRLAERWEAPGIAGGSLSASSGGRLAFTNAGRDHPDDVFLLDPGSAQPRRLTRMNPQLGRFTFPAPRPVTWTSFDGRRIEGIVYEPDESAPRPVPLVVQPHGGPSYQWSLDFYADAHSPALFLAARGYAVFYPNPRGSTGYGEAFNALNRGDLGGGDFRDINAGVDSLVAAGLADPRRLAIDGYSYGGFMTAWTISHTDRYRCAVVGAGPMDFFSDYAQNDLTPYWQQEFLGGSPYEDPAAYWKRSPITYARNVRTPVLIVHGADDVRVPLAQSREFHAALKEFGVPVSFFIYPREGHGLVEPKHQIEFMKRQWEWFERHLNPPD